MAGKNMTLMFYRQNHVKTDWQVDVGSNLFQEAISALQEELATYQVILSLASNDTVTIDVKSYADLLNAVRIVSPSDGFGNLCIGHIIGKSPNLDLLEDIRTAVNRIAFAPETVPPEDHNRRVCHNCGCGC